MAQPADHMPAIPAATTGSGVTRLHPAWPADGPVPPALARLAAAHGVATAHHDWRGAEVGARIPTVVAVLGALGVDAATPDAAERSLAGQEAARRARLLPPVLVTRAARDSAFTAHVPPGARLELWIELEDGGVRRDIGQCLGAGDPGDGVEERVCTLPAGLPLGWHTVHARRFPATDLPLGSGGVPGGAPGGSAVGHGAAMTLVVTPDRLAPPPGGRTWGWMVQLYSLRSRRSWGVGDLGDLADLAGWSARAHGAGFVLVNPLHAASPVPPVEPSPYLPVTRRFTDPMYVRVEAVEEYAHLPPADRALVDDLRAEACHADGEHLDRDAVRIAKREALALVHAVPRGPGREAAYSAHLAREGAWLEDHATWCALTEEYGPSWRAWPVELRDPASPAVAAARERLAETVDLHRWTQWIADEQLARTQAAATDAGMPVGIVHDLAVGVHPDGSDAWVLGSGGDGVLALGASGGAPPDDMNARGQDWGQPPWHPGRLAEAGYRPYRDLVRAACRHAGAVRVDHILGLFRFWWVPAGNSPADGAYVRSDHEAMVGILALEAHRAGTVVIGEDLGTVEPWVRDHLAERGILGTSVLWFEHGPDGAPLPPEHWRELSLATVTTHDLPPTAARLAGEHVDLWERLGLLVRPAEAERAAADADREAWLGLVRRRGLLRPGAGERESIEALHRLAAAGPSRMFGVWLPDAVGDRRPQNLPGTSTQYPNWLLPVTGPDGRQIRLEDLVKDPRARSLARALRSR